MNKRPSDGAALHFASGKSGGQRVGAMGNGNAMKQGVGAVGAFLRGNPEQEERELDVFSHAKGWKEVEKLEDITQTLSAQGSERVAAHACEVFPCDEDFAAVGAVDAAEAV